MSVTSLVIKGLRGFSTEQVLKFAQPSGAIGSGMTILVGPNNGGKSTIIESLRDFSGLRNQLSFSENKRNHAAGDCVVIHLQLNAGNRYTIQTVDSGGSEAIRKPRNGRLPHNLYVLPSRRYFNPYFSNRGQGQRENYTQLIGNDTTRGGPSNIFSNRLFEALGKEDFKALLSRVMDPPLEWTIDLSDQGKHYLKSKIDNANHYHNSEGLGEGIVSLLFIVDSLYDSQPGEMIVIDEPELSLHPTYQRRLARLFANYAKDRQIVYATHSPYFVDFEHILNGAEIARVHKNAEGSIISQLSRPTVIELQGFLKDKNNPHILGLEARETFFQDDGVVLVEGQEDVVRYPDVLDQLEKAGQLSGRCVFGLKERFFGWGAGGADKIEKIAAILLDLGFEYVAAILDSNKVELIPGLQEKFPNYCFVSIEAEDIRTKESVCTKESVKGLLDDEGQLRQEFIQKTGEIFIEISEHVLPD